MAKKYHIDYKDVDGTDISIGIYNDSWVGASTPLRLQRDSVVLRGENTKPVNGQTLDFTLIVNQLGQYNELFNGDPTDFWVRMERDSVVEFEGFIANETFKELIENKAIWPVHITCHSGFKWLREKKIDDLETLDRQDNITVMEWVWGMLTEVGIRFDNIKVFSSVYAYVADDTETDRTVFDLYLRGQSLINPNGDSKTIYQFFEEFLKQWNMYMIKEGSSIVIQKRDEISSADQGFRRLVTYNTSTTKTLSSVPFSAKRQIVTDQFYIKRKANHTITNGTKQLNITEDFTTVDELIDMTTAADISINDTGDFAFNESFLTEAENAVVGEWVAKTGSAMDVSYEPKNKSFFFENLNTATQPSDIQTLVNSGIYQKVRVRQESGAHSRKLKVKFKIEAYENVPEMHALCWIMYKDSGTNGWTNVYINVYKNMVGSVKQRKMDQVDANGVYQRPILSGRAFKDIPSGESTDVEFELDLHNDLRDLGSDGLRQQSNIGSVYQILGGTVDFIFGFCPPRYGYISPYSNFFSGKAVSSECRISNISVKYEQDLGDDRTIHGNTVTYDSNLSFKAVEEVKVTYPIDLPLEYTQALLFDSNGQRINLLNDDSWSLTLQNHDDMIARWRISETSTPYNKLKVLIRNKGETLRIGDTIEVTGDLAGDYIVEEIEYDVAQGLYQCEIAEFKKDTSITIN